MHSCLNTHNVIILPLNLYAVHYYTKHESVLRYQLLSNNISIMHSCDLMGLYGITVHTLYPITSLEHGFFSLKTLTEIYIFCILNFTQK